MNTSSVQNEINDFEDKADRFLSWIKEYHTGRENSITSTNMQSWGNPRQIRSIIHHLRMNCHPICSYSKGYYYGETKDDIQKTIRFMLDPRKIESIEALKITMNNLPELEVEGFNK